MPTVNLSPVGGAAAQFFDNAGNVLTGGKIFTYAAGTTTPEVTYTTNSGVIAHTNPIILDASGRVPSGGEIWLTANINYKFVLKDSNDVLIGTYDNISTFASDATLVTYTPASANAVQTTVARKLYQTVSVFDFMTLAQQTDVTAGTMLLDVTTPIQNAINSLERGVLTFPPGYYKTTSTIDILNKNDQNDATQSDFQISAYGAKIVSTVSGSTPALYIHACKRLVIRGLELSAASTTLTVQVQGLWYSTIEDCTFGNIQFSGLGAVFDSHYLNRFQSCFFNTVTLRTGTNADRSEFNGNIFDSCLIWFGEYGIKKYGDHGLEGLTFINCDISYQTVAILYVDEPTFGSMNFIGCYFDSAPGFPQDTKGIQLDFNGAIWNPNSANVSNFLVATASASQSKSNGGVRTGDRIPTSGYNLISNGDIRAGNAGFTTFNTTTAITAGTGLFGQYAKFTSSAAFGNFSFPSIAVPVSGVYTLTVIGRAITPGGSATSCNGVFGVVQLASDWTIGSFSTFINQGSSVSFTVTNAATGSFEYDIAYVGLTYGKSAPLYAPIHPTADFYSPGTQQSGFTDLTVNNLTLNTAFVQAGIKTQVYSKSYTASTSPTDILFINSSSGFPVIEVDVYFSDISFPDSVFLQKLYIVGRGSGTAVLSTAITQQDLIQSFNTGGTQYLTWTTSVVSNQIMLTATASAATGGTGTLTLTVRGFAFSGAVVQ
jgi:hypothetical protein